jgi:predicted phosphodiesterase
MLDDFQPIVHELPGRTIRVWAVADVHIGAKECDLNGFQKFIDDKILGDPDGYVVLCGDLISNGIKDSLTNVYDEVMPPQLQIDRCVELLRPVAHKILGCVSGNHERRSKKHVDINPMGYICSLLRIPEVYRENMAFVRVNLKRGSTRDHYALLLVHGKTANKRRQFAYAVEGVDAIISGHTHDGEVQKPARLVFTKSNRVVVKPLVNVCATSWLNPGGYSLAGMMTPKSTGDPQCLVLEFTGSNGKQGNIRVNW